MLFQRNILTEDQHMLKLADWFAIQFTSQGICILLRFVVVHVAG